MDGSALEAGCKIRLRTREIPPFSLKNSSRFVRNDSHIHDHPDQTKKPMIARINAQS